MDEAAIRQDERFKVAALLEKHAETLSDFTGDSEAVVRLISYMLRLSPGPRQPE